MRLKDHKKYVYTELYDRMWWLFATTHKNDVLPKSDDLNLLTEIFFGEILKDMSAAWLPSAASMLKSILLRKHARIFVYCATIITIRVSFELGQHCMTM